MAIIYGVGLAMALLTGGAIGMFLTNAYHERIAPQHRQYEKEIAGDRDFYAILATLRPIKPVNPAGSQASAA